MSVSCKVLPSALALGLLVAGCGAHASSTQAVQVTHPPTTTAAPSRSPTRTPTPTKTLPPTPTPKATPTRTLAPTTSHPAPAPTTHSAAPTPAHTAAPVPTHGAYPATLAAIPSSASQAITVTASSYGATTATYEAWQRSGSTWQLVYGPWTAHLGYHGMAPPGDKREGDGRIPSGVYGFSYLFGVQADPGVHYTWRPVTGTYDVWDDDSTSSRYNEWVDDRTASAGVSPEPMDNTPVYDEGAVIAYNTARTPGLGSAIFMHVSDGGPTAGCVSIAQGDLTQVLRWMRPGTDISIGVG